MKLTIYEIENDLIYQVDDNGNRKLIPDKRLNGKQIVDIKTYNKFYVDSKGIKHIIKFDDSWQEINCKLDDELEYINDKLIVKSQNLTLMQNEYLDLLNKLTTNWIYKFYPLVKQKSDLIDKEYLSTCIISRTDITTDKLFAEVYSIATKILDNQISLTTYLDSKPDSLRYAYEQLIKVAVRQTLVEQVKQIHNSYKQQILKAKSVDELQKINLNNIDYPILPKGF